MLENKREIPAYPGYYADTKGNIYSHRSGREKKLSQRIHRNYYHVTVKNKKKSKIAVHRLILETFVGPREESQVCRHLNGDSLDNRIENLKWGTVKENVADSIKHGTAVCLRHGEQAIASKLKLEDILKIKWLYKFGYKQVALSRWFKVSQKHISDIINNKTWKKDLMS